MRKTLLTAALASAVATGGSAMAQPARAQPDRGLNFSDVAARLESQGFQIHEMERERGVIEVKATDRSGRRMKLQVDAATGQVLRQDERTGRHAGW
ncbi:PepSY domain-containing protein [Falsiroseomonas ponticola]|uniref:PepSY domain-containing protein n=1 Tax=Falsiroseomonas ponticola TaxID=2786951 RepID=UPI0019326891|nr:PepSY domain-containing protein [Roseomonas ponticola]